ncbi:hypothetical protein ACHAWF_012699 [Thalassiosira exigua]
MSDAELEKLPVAVADSKKEGSPEPSKPYALSTAATKPRCIFISSVIVASHALFLWGQLDTLWSQFLYYDVAVDVDAANDATKSAAEQLLGRSSASIEREQTDAVSEWSYGSMLSMLWQSSKGVAFVLFAFSAFWPHFKLALLHLYLYLPVPSKPRGAALYWLDAFGKMSLADVTAICILFLLINVQADINVGALASDASQLMGDVIPYIVDSVLPGDISNKTETILNKAGAWAYEEVVGLTDSISANGDSSIYKLLLEKGCAEVYNGGATCEDTPFYTPTNVFGGIAGIMMKCLRIRNDKCSQCECIVNNAVYNRAIPGGPLQAKLQDAASAVFAKILSAVKSGDVDFASWIDVRGNASAGSYIKIHPAFLGFTIGVILSIVASLLVLRVEEKDSMKRYRDADSLGEALENAGVEDQKSHLFATTGSCRGWLKKLSSIVFAIGIIPMVFFAVYVQMMKVVMAGLVPSLMFQQSEAVESSYSIIDSVKAVNDGSGYGKAFTVIYGTAMLGIPMLRATLLAVVTLVPMPPLWQLRFARMSNNVGSYIGWEPFFIVLVVLLLALSHITGTAVSPEQCQSIQERNIVSYMIDNFGLDTNTCFVMYFELHPSFALMVIAWALLTGFNAYAWNTVIKRYDPYGTYAREGDNGGPYCRFRHCCYFGCFWPKRREPTAEMAITADEDEEQ